MIAKSCAKQLRIAARLPRVKLTARPYDSFNTYLRFTASNRSCSKWARSQGREKSSAGAGVVGHFEKARQSQPSPVWLAWRFDERNGLHKRLRQALLGGCQRDRAARDPVARVQAHAHFHSSAMGTGEIKAGIFTQGGQQIIREIFEPGDMPVQVGISSGVLGLGDDGQGDGVEGPAVIRKDREQDVAGVGFPMFFLKEEGEGWLAFEGLAQLGQLIARGRRRNGRTNRFPKIMPAGKSRISLRPLVPMALTLRRILWILSEVMVRGRLAMMVSR